jgi:hypothetical protein
MTRVGRCEIRCLKAGHCSFGKGTFASLTKGTMEIYEEKKNLQRAKLKSIKSRTA